MDACQHVCVCVRMYRSAHVCGVRGEGEENAMRRPSFVRQMLGEGGLSMAWLIDYDGATIVAKVPKPSLGYSEKGLPSPHQPALRSVLCAVNTRRADGTATGHRLE